MSSSAVYLFAFAKDLSCKQRFVGGDCINFEGGHLFHLFAFVDGPNIGAHSEVVCLFNPLRVVGDYLLVVVKAIDSE